jgi:exodeoxyribonuclease V alpha subunit
MDTLSGTISRVLFFNEYTNYTVFHLDGESGSEVITGNFPQLSEGESVTVHGHFVEHKTYGKQFQAHSYEINVPTDEESLKKYLASGLFKGIGPALADALVTHFGTEVLNVIKSNPQRLTTVPKIGVKTAENIRLSYAEQEKSREVMMFMQKYGISTSLALKIYKVYQDASHSNYQPKPLSHH